MPLSSDYFRLIIIHVVIPFINHIPCFQLDHKSLQSRNLSLKPFATLWGAYHRNLHEGDANQSLLAPVIYGFAYKFNNYLLVLRAYNSMPVQCLYNDLDILNRIL